MPLPHQKIRVGILFGGKSAEHEVSLQSAKNVVDALDRDRFEPTLIKIEKDGHWPDGIVAGLMAGTSDLEVVFPILHGPFGEDGTVQGLLKLAGLPFVGSSVLGSAVGMDKDVMKRLLHEAGLPIGKFVALRDTDTPDYEATVAALGLPLFVKPANLGSSVGISKVRNAEEFTGALAEAFRYDRKVVIEAFIEGREIECAVLGNDEPIASVPGEIVANVDFYSYEAKYLDENGATMEIPAKLSEQKTREIQALAVRVFKVLESAGLGRVDFFLKPDGEVIVNEINTMPGFTSISMYPLLWEATGLPYRDLIMRLLELAIERHAKEARLQTTRE
jgi:D-alanine-D-alanine ligase